MLNAVQVSCFCFYNTKTDVSILVCQDQIPQVTEACGVIIKYFLSRLETSTNAEIKQFLYPLKSLCEGKNQIPAFDQNVLISLLKNAKHPEHKTVTGKFKNNLSSKKC